MQSGIAIRYVDAIWVISILITFVRFRPRDSMFSCGIAFELWGFLNFNFDIILQIICKDAIELLDRRSVLDKTKRNSKESKKVLKNSTFMG